DAATVAGGRRLLAPTIVHLNLVQPLELDAGIGTLGDHELDMSFNRPEFSLGHQILGGSFFAVRDDSASGLYPQALRIGGIEFRVAANQPFARTGLPPFQLLVVD